MYAFTSIGTPEYTEVPEYSSSTEGVTVLAAEAKVVKPASVHEGTLGNTISNYQGRRGSAVSERESKCHL